jgi:hypothetical protein
MLTLKTSFKKIMKLFSIHPYITLLIPIFFVAYPLLLVPGIPIGNGDLPYLETSLYGFKTIWMWVEYGSYHNLEALPRFPIVGLFLILQLLGVTPDLISKLLIISGFFTASFSFYYSCILFFKSKIDVQNIKFKIAAILGSLFYAYNVWSFHRIGHWYFWIGYGLLPIFFMSVIYALRNPKKLHYVLACILLWTLASSNPHMVIFYALIFVSFSIIFLIKSFRKRNEFLKLLIPIFLIISVYPLINLYWIYPYVSSSTSERFLRSTVVTQDSTDDLSRESNFVNVFRLIEGTFNMGTIKVVPPENSLLYPFWIFAAFVPPIVALTSLLFGRNLILRKSILFFFLAVVIGILFTIGSNAPFNLYSILLFNIPLLSHLQVLFREPDKWGFLIGFGYSFLITISSIIILNKFQEIRYNRKISISFIAFMLVSITIYFYPAYSDSLNNLYHPVILPDDFGMLSNNSLVSFTNASKVFFMPYSTEPTIWGGDKGTLDIYPISSPLPNIAPSDYNTLERYHKYLVSSIIKNKTNSINNALSPLADYLLYHNDTFMADNKDLLTKLAILDRLEHIGDIGFFKVFKVGTAKMAQLNIPLSNVLVAGGLNQFTSLNSLPNFDPTNSSLFFLDQRIKNTKDKSVINNSQYLLSSTDANDFIFSLIDGSHIIAPFDATNRHDPSTVWSKAGVNDPGNAWFNPYLEELGIENWDFDYGKGLVLTKAMGDNLSIPINVVESGDYDLFIRYLKNPQGGLINIYMDDEPKSELYTKDNRSANFVWKNLGSLNLTKSKHTLTLENAFGFNAVNIFALIPVKELSKLADSAESIANKMGNIVYLLEAETGFVNSKGKDNGNVYPLFYYNLGNGTFSKTFTSQFKVPANSNLLSLQVLAKPQPISNSSYSFKNLEISSAEKKDVFLNDFENRSTPLGVSNKKWINYDQKILTNDFENRSTPLGVSNKQWINYDQRIFTNDFENRSTPLGVSNKKWINYDQKILSMSSIPSKGMIGNNSLKVDVGKGNATNWSVISTDFIPVDENTYYNYSLDLSAKDVHQLHSKVLYYDSNKREIKEDFIFGGRNGTFVDSTTKILQIPSNTSSIKFQMWVHQNPIKNSSYILYDTRILPTGLKEVWSNDNKDTQTISIGVNNVTAGNNSLKVDVGHGNATNWSVISTDFIPVDENTYYNYSLDLSAKDVSVLHSKVLYYDSNKREIDSDIVYGGRDGTFEDSIRQSILPLTGTKYIKLQLLVHPNSRQGKTSMYWIDNVKLENLAPSGAGIIFKNDFSNFENLYPKDQKLEIVHKFGSAYLKNELRKDNSSYYRVIATKSLPVKENGLYNYTLAIDADNTNSLVALASFRNSDDVKSSTKYGTNASNGMILTLSNGSEISTDLDILKSSNYIIALRANTCKSCTYPTVNIVSKQNNIDKTGSNISLNTAGDTEINSSQLEWLYSNSTHLNKGEYKLKIHSKSPIDLDSVVVYSTDNNTNYNVLNNKHNKIFDLFTLKDKSPLARISEYKKINPTKYVINVNATKPFIISLAESYDPLWIVYATDKSNFKTNSFPLYSTINGFYINKTGNYTLNMEYIPQKWFEEAAIVSIVTLFLIIGFIVMLHYKKILFKFKD